ncbi:MAG: hypothetical protein ACOX6N_03490 [Patescibacteria group bacterium]|jgi:hypothetical protein
MNKNMVQKKDNSTTYWLIGAVVGLPVLLFLYISYLQSQGKCLVVNIKGSTHNSQCDGLENSFTNFIYVIGIFLLYGIVHYLTGVISGFVNTISSKLGFSTARKEEQVENEIEGLVKMRKVMLKILKIIGIIFLVLLVLIFIALVFSV